MQVPNLGGDQLKLHQAVNGNPLFHIPGEDESGEESSDGESGESENDDDDESNDESDGGSERDVDAEVEYARKLFN